MRQARPAPRRTAARRDIGSGWRAGFLAGVVLVTASLGVLTYALVDAAGLFNHTAAEDLLPVLPPRDPTAPSQSTAAVPVAGTRPAAAATQAPTATTEADPEETEAAPAAAIATAPSPPRTQAISRPAAYSPETELQRITSEYLGDDESTGVVVISPMGEVVADINGAGQWYAASLFKLTILYHALMMLDLDLVTLDDRVTITDEAWEEDLGTAGSLPVDGEGTISLSEALTAMVTISDNTSAVALLRFFGPGEVDLTLSGIGLAVTSVNTRDLPTTAEDMAFLMEAIVRGPSLSDESHALGSDLLLAQTVRDGIPSGIPGGVTVGNKTGTWNGATHDVAFVQTSRGTFIIAILSDWGWGGISELASLLFDNFG